jgi:tetratricopeptide (TPR) repeat protein
MRAIISSISLIFIYFSLGCATQAVQTERLLSNPGALPTYFNIKNVEFIDQSSGYCGPAVLTMAMRRAGQNIEVEEVASQVYTPGLHGSLQADIVSAARRQGLMAITIQNLPTLLNEVSAGHPVIIFENLGLSWAPQWHYALVLGYDLQKQEVILHTGHDAYYHWDMKKFERSWMLGDYWGLVVLPAGEIAVSSGERANLTSAVGLQKAKKNIEAEKSFRKILEKWPSSLVALIGSANFAFDKRDYKEAIKLLRRAIKAHPESMAAKHNLTIASFRAADK